MCWLALVGAVACPCAARVVLNEIYYDHAGADAGHEFIELASDDSATVDLTGVAIEFHNGAGTGWVGVWRAASGTALAADALFVVGDELVTPPPNVVVALALQNGPDALRLVAADGVVLDVVGYGGLDDPAYVEGHGVPAVTAGKSIARAMDAVDTDDNAADFVVATPTPGRHNLARYDAALALAAGTPARAGRDYPGTETVAVLLQNHGRVPIEPGAAAVTAFDSTCAGVSTPGSAANRSVVPPGGEERVALSLPLGPGYHWLRIEARYPGDERPGNDGLRAMRRMSRIPVLVSEVWSAPRDGCPQFVEWMNAGAESVDASAFMLRDARARPVPLDVDSLRLAPGDWLAVTSDVARLSACVPGTPGARVVGVRGLWPAFNRSGGAVADSVVVLDAYAIPVDAVSYPALPSAARGRSLERVDLFLHDGPAVWRVSEAPGGCSPARPNGAFIDEPAAADAVEVSPNPFSPASGDLLRVAINPQPPVARVDAWVYDLDGRRTASLGGATSFPALLVWDGRSDDGGTVRPGLYIVACEAFRSDGVRLRVQRVVVGCAGRMVP